MPFRRGIMTGGVFGLAPNPPTGGGASSGANGQSVLTWSAPVNDGGGTISDYLVRYSTDDATWTVFSDGVNASTGATVTGLSNGTLYYFQVAAVNAYGTSGYSSSFSGTPSTIPNAVQSLSLSAGDRSITATWSAPASNGGSAITSYTVETQRNSEGWVNQGSQSSGVSFTVRNNTAVTARSYKVRVTANNANGGTSAESSSATPAFGTPASTWGSAIAPPNPYNGANGSGARTFYASFSPLQCAAFDRCELHIAREGYEYQPYGNNYLLNVTSNHANQNYEISSHYQNALGWYTPTAGINYYSFTRTFNTDGDYKDSTPVFICTTTATQSYVWTTYGDNSDWGAATSYSGATGTFIITGNSFSQTSGYAIPGQNAGGAGNVQYSITRLDIEAWVGASGVTICTASRNFLVDFSGTSTSAGTGGGTQDCRTPPFSNNSGTTHRTLEWNVANVPFGNAGAGRIRVRGAGSISTFSTSPDERIRCIVNVIGQQRSWVVSSYPINTTYYY